MNQTHQYPRRLIEVDLPIARISAHARREKSIRHGHISTLHIWWARRPLAACRAVICAALWPDPADPLCPPKFRENAVRIITAFARRVVGKDTKFEGLPAGRQGGLQATCSPESFGRWEGLTNGKLAFDPANPDHLNTLRFALLDFIADFANWDNSTVPAYLETARALTQSAHEALGGEPGTRPLVVDPFAGGGSIPLEALRVGADAFASDLNPVAVLLNKVVLEYIPKYGQRLADEVRKWGQWVKEQAEKELAEFYPKDPDGATPIAYLWARTIQCEGPGCGAEVPLIRSLWLAKKAKRSVALKLVPKPKAKRVDLEIIENAKPKDVAEGTVKRGSATCTCCGYTTPVTSVRKQLKARCGGAADARLFCVVTTRPGQQGRFYRLPTERDCKAQRKAADELEQRKKQHKGPMSLLPEEEICQNELRRISVPIYGMTVWADLYAPRQLLLLTTLVRLTREAFSGPQTLESGLASAVRTCLAFSVDKLSDKQSTFTGWKPTAEYMAGHTFARQAIGMVWDWCEAGVFSEASGSYSAEVSWVVEVLEHGHSSTVALVQGHVALASATDQPTPDDSAQALITDPPYYDAVPYAHLSDYFYVWLRRMLSRNTEDFMTTEVVPKEREIVVDRPHKLSSSDKDVAFYERELTRAFADSRRVLRADGICAIVFASKTTASWEAILKAVVDSGWIIVGSWPIDTEMEMRLAAMGQARLSSSVHLVCRPRENPDGSLRTDEVGEWRDVLAELPPRIHEWMPRLAQEGIVGADAIFACLGPALEIFSRYSRVEKQNGDKVELREYLEKVWAAVSTEALSLIFRNADAGGLEPDARLTAMWLWTVGGKDKTNHRDTESTEKTEESEEEEEENGRAVKAAGYALEFDAARKIAQGLGVHLEKSEGIVEVKGDTARLLPVAERTRYLFGKDAGSGAPAKGKGKKKATQPTLFAELAEAEAADGGLKVQTPPAGATVLDRLHQSMILFAAGRGEYLKRFLVDDGVGKDTRFWKLAQSLSALYPGGTDEKRWVDGVLARKKGLGL